MQFTKSLTNLSAQDLMIAGGKGASLGEMLAAGIPVPGGFVILSTTFDYFLHQTGLDIQVESILEKVDHKTIFSVERASEDIQSLILSFSMPEEIEKEIIESFKIHELTYVAVRSSATAEDGAEHARAGQLESFLNTTKDDLIEKVRKCRASLFTPRAIFYRFEKDLHRDHISVAVVVQKMVQSEVSGIAFSVHPVTQDYNQMIIEAGYGLGEAIVSGSVTPDSYVVTKDDKKVDITVNHQQKALYRSDIGDNERVELGDQGAQEALTHDQILELSEIILHIEQHYGFPCDIEWAYEAGRFYITQSRPITTLGDADKDVIALERKEEHDRKLHIWKKLLTRKNSIFMDYFKLKGSSQLLYDVGYDYRVANYKIIDGDNYTADDYDTYFQNLEKVYKENPAILSSILDTGYTKAQEVIGLATAIGGPDLSQYETKQLRDIFDEYMLGLYQLMAFLFPPLFAEKILTDKIKDILEKNNVVDRDIALSTLTYPKEESILQVEEGELEELISNIKKSPNLEDTLIDNYLQKWQWLGDHNFTFNYMKKEDIVERVNIGNVQTKNIFLEAQKEFNQLFSSLLLTEEDKYIIETARKYVHFRTYRLDIMFQSAYIAYNLFSEIAVRLHTSVDDMLYLTSDEISNYLGSEAWNIDIDTIIGERKNHYAIVLEDYNLHVYGGDNALQFQEKLITYEGKTLQGNSAFLGRRQGKVRIIHHKKDFKNFQAGEVLVCSMTTPDFVPLMKQALGIITDEGGITCHAAIVSRELQIPCIIGTKIATQALKDGDLVEVNADNGIVRILARSV